MAVVETVQHGLDAVEQREQTGVSLFCPEHGQSLGHTAPKTPGCAPATQAPTRPVSTEDDGPEAAPSEPDDDKLHPKTCRQYDKWSAEEEQIFFLKLQTVASVELTEGLRCIAQHLPSRSSSQVKDYYYRLRGQFQKFTDKDVECLTHKEMFQAMSHMWILWCGGRKRKHKLAWGLQNKPEKKSRYVETLQQSVDLVFEARNKKAERQAQKKADRQATKLKAKEADQAANPTSTKPSRGSQKQPAVCQKENSSSASNLRTSRQAQAPKSAVQACTEALHAVSGYIPTVRSRMSSSSRQASAHPHQFTQLYDHPKSDRPNAGVSAQLGQLPQLQEGSLPDHQAAPATAQQALAQLAQQSVPDKGEHDSNFCTLPQRLQYKQRHQHQQPPVTQGNEQQQQKQQQVPPLQHVHQQQEQLQADVARNAVRLSFQGAAAAQQNGEEQFAAHQAACSQQSLAGGSSQGSKQPQLLEPEQLQQASTAHLHLSTSVSEMLQPPHGEELQQQQPGQQQGACEQQQSMPRAQSSQKELLCLRLRPKDAETRRLLQSLGLKAQLEMPNNKPKKGLGGLLKHLQAKWQQVADQLGEGVQLHLLGTMPQQQASSLFWTAASIPSTLTLGDVKQQLQQAGSMLELQYGWMPPQLACSALEQHLQDTHCQRQQSVSDRGTAQGSCADAFSVSATQSQPEHTAAGGDRQPIRTPFGSPLNAASRHQSGAASSSSSAHVPEEAVNSAQRPDLRNRQEHASLEEQQPQADAVLSAPAALDVVSSVSGLVTPCKAQHSILQNDHSASCRKSTHSKASCLHSQYVTDWQGSSMPEAANLCAPTPHSHRRASMDQPQTQAKPAAPSGHLAQQTVPEQSAFQTAADGHITEACTTAATAQPLSEHGYAEQSAQLFSALPGELSEQAPEHSLAQHRAADGLCTWDECHGGAVGDLQLPSSLPEQPFTNLATIVRPADHAKAADSAMLEEHTKPAEFDIPAEHAGLSNEDSDMLSLPDPLELSILDFPEDEPSQAVHEADHCEAAALQPQNSDMFQGSQTQPETDKLPIRQQSMSSLLMSEHLQEQPMAHCCEALQAGTLNLAPLASDCTAGPHNSSQIVSGFNAVPDTVAEGTCEPEQPAVGIPLLGTVVVGRPVQPLKRRGGARGPVGTRGSSQGRSRQPKQGTEGIDAGQQQPTKAAVKSKRKRKPAAAASDGSLGGQQSQGLSCPDQDGPAALQPAGKQRKKRPAATPRKKRSPAKLPSLSPMAVSLKEGVKRRRLAKEAEAQSAQQQGGHASATAATDAAANTHQACPQGQAPCQQQHICWETEDNSAAAAAQHATCSQQQLQDMPSHASNADRPPADLHAEDMHQQQQGQQQHQHQQCHLQQQQQQQACVQDKLQEQAGSGGVSFDVRGMDLFNQQDTCDAFGSFWHSTTGAECAQGSAAAEAGPSGQVAATANAFVGDISLGCWSTDPQHPQQMSNTADRSSTAQAAEPSGVMPHQTQVAAACCQQELDRHQSPAADSLNLMAYFDTLADGNATCRSLITPLTGAIRLDTPAQHAQQPLPEPSFESLFCQESSLSLISTDEEPRSTQPDSSQLSRQPTAHEIQYMDELDLTDNLGSLLGPGDSWLVPEDMHAGALQESMAKGADTSSGFAGGTSTTAQPLNAKPFQELFPLSA